MSILGNPMNRMINRAARRAVRRQKHRLLKFAGKAIVMTMVINAIMPGGIAGQRNNQHDAAAVEFQQTVEQALEQPKTATDIAEEAKDKLSELLGSIIGGADYSTEESTESTVNAVYDVAEEFADENGVVFARASLTRVVDGDTIVVDIYGDACGDKAHEYSVRLIGVNTPESVASEEYLERKGTTNSEEGKAASDYTKAILDGVENLYMQTDVSDTDRYGRLLRYVWLDVPSDAYDIDEVTNKMLNGILVRDGYAECAVYKPDTMYADYFAAIERGTTDDFEVDR